MRACACGKTAGHILRVTLAVECHEPADADCRTVTGGCLVTEQADGAIPFAEYHDGPDDEPLADGMRIVAKWSSADECYCWHGDLEDGAR